MTNTHDQAIQPSLTHNRRPWTIGQLLGALASHEQLLIAGMALVVLALNAPFLLMPHFWDDLGFVAAAEHMLNNRFSPIVPAAWDYGRPVLLSETLALAWLVFGKSILVAHLVIVIFAFLAVFYSYRLGRALYDRRTGLIAAALLLCYPLFRAQSTVICPELPAAALAVMSLYALVHGNRIRFVLYASAMVLMTTISVALIPAVLIYLLARNDRPYSWHQRIASLAFHSLPLFVAAGWLWFHYQTTGWVADSHNIGWLASLTPPRSPDEVIPFLIDLLFGEPGALRSFVALAWPYFGKVFLIGLLTLLIVLYSFSLRPFIALKRGTFSWRALGKAIHAQPIWRAWGNQGQLMLLGLPIILWLALMSITTTMHRSLLPAYCLFFLLAARAIQGIFKPARVATIAVLSMLVLFTLGTTNTWFGNSLSSPSTLRYLDYVRIHQAAAAFIDTHYPDKTVLARRPEYSELAMPLHGYVARPINILAYVADDIHKERILSLGGRAFYDPTTLTADDFDLVYVTGQTVPDNTYRPDGTMITDIVQRFQLPLIAEFKLNTNYVKIYANPRILAAAR